MALIRCEGLAVGYNNQSIVDNLTFDINFGDYLCILGNNGSGKTTLMRTILGLQRPVSGSLIFGDGLHCNEIGYLPQQTSIQRDFPASALEVVLSGCLNRSRSPFYTAKQKKLAKEKMHSLGIENLGAACYRELSGGQQQRVLLARALCASSKLILLDEPVAGLDPQATEAMYGVIEQLHQNGVAVVMVSHDVDAALRYATHILHVASRPKFFGTAEDYRQSDVFKNARAGGRRL